MTKAASPAKGRSKKQANPSTNREKKGVQSIAETKEDLVVFAFRLTASERELLHKAAGPANASRFVRTLVVAAARGDRVRLEKFMEGVPRAIQ